MAERVLCSGLRSSEKAEQMTQAARVGQFVDKIVAVSTNRPCKHRSLLRKARPRPSRSRASSGIPFADHLLLFPSCTHSFNSIDFAPAVIMGVEPPFLYDHPSRYSFNGPTDKGYNPRAATVASWTPAAPKAKRDGPLVEFNRHPDSVSDTPVSLQAQSDVLLVPDCSVRQPQCQTYESQYREENQTLKTASALPTGASVYWSIGIFVLCHCD